MKNKENIRGEYTNLVLNRIIALYNDYLSFTNKYDKIKDNEPEKIIDFLIELLYK